MIYYSQLLTAKRILLHLACIVFYIPPFKYPLGNADYRGVFSPETLKGKKNPKYAVLQPKLWRTPHLKPDS